MSREDLESFRSLVVTDERLQERLRGADREAFAGEVASAAAERGLEVTPEDVDDTLRARRRAWRRTWV